MLAPASIRIIEKVEKHPDADRLELATILGYQCVVQKGLYLGGEKIVYITTDSLLPVEAWTEEYRKYSPKRIKAVKLRGEWSEGIIVPFSILPTDLSDKEEGDDVSELIGVTHYEPPAPQDLKTKASALPLGIPKTDEERWESMKNKLPMGKIVDVSLKIDGQSCSYYYNVRTEEFGILGRTQELYEMFENNYTNNIKIHDIKNKLIDYCKKHDKSLCIRGESYGNSLQNSHQNVHAGKPKAWAMFSVFDIDSHEYANKGTDHYFLKVAEATGLPTVDILEKDVVLTQELINKYSVDLEKVNDNPFEGVVVKHDEGSFKVINKTYDSNK